MTVTTPGAPTRCFARANGYAAGRMPRTAPGASTPFLAGAKGRAA
jgi:hypothetical protein